MIPPFLLVTSKVFHVVFWQFLQEKMRMKTTGKAHTEMGVFTGDTWSSMSCYTYWNVGAQVDTVKDKFAQSDGVWGLNKFCIILKQ